MTKRLTTPEGIQSVLQDLNIHIVNTDLDGSCRAAVRKHLDGYCILLEESLCFDAKIKALQHELCHIILGHLDNDAISFNEKEKEACLACTDIKT